jgi:hypothetical protein
MIEKGDCIMSTKNEYTIAELEAQYKTAEENQKKLKQQIEQKKKEEAELREAKLELEKHARKKEVDDAIERAKKLLRTYMKDYGVYSYASNNDIFDMFSSKFWNQIV